IGIIVAMRKELDLLLPLLQDSEESRMSGFDFYRGKVGRHDVIAMQCGIGKVNAAMGTLTLVNAFLPDFVINSGVAGGADMSVNVMDVVAGARVAYHDVWCGPESELGQVQGLPLYFQGAKRMIELVPEREGIHKGLICSGDQFIDKMEDVKRIKGNFPDALAVDMESGAIAQVCYLSKVPFLALRVISDSPGASHDNTRQYLDFWNDAPQETFALVKDIITKL
ncbi:MAG: 5'-methylthioadenosine/adenosylhomocysteine nucleosidase, partial [Muribaculaceae bacterium]|nr:5'-methylthioadenosine/adenosylhomocysteine nucleosidase [Muribaculaceae bacterium]